MVDVNVKDKIFSNVYIQNCWEPLLCSTAKCFTRVICQSDVPVFIPKTAQILVDVSLTPVTLDRLTLKMFHEVLNIRNILNFHAHFFTTKDVKLCGNVCPI
uniref:DUF4773 domain-containing protein n=1 Tax=Angiostrongylus cantonensis TaxID=6313 RepID=A0A0K0CVI9_ANGCA